MRLNSSNVRHIKYPFYPCHIVLTADFRVDANFGKDDAYYRIVLVPTCHIGFPDRRESKLISWP